MRVGSIKKKVGRLRFSLIAVLIFPLFGITAFFIGEEQKKEPDFCVSCHLPGGNLHQPKMDLMKISPAESLAGVHYRLDTGPLGCPDCHKGIGWREKLIIAWLEVTNTLKYFVGSFEEPAEMDHPVNVELCVGCHDELKPRADPLSFHSFNSHNGMKQVTCVECHAIHSPKQPDGRLLNIKKVLGQCDLCHKNSETSPMVRRTLGLDGG